MKKLVGAFVIAIVGYVSPLSAQSVSAQQREFMAAFDKCIEDMNSTALEVVKTRLFRDCNDKFYQLLTPTIDRWVGATFLVSATETSANVEIWTRPMNSRTNVILRATSEAIVTKTGSIPAPGHREFVDQLVSLKLRDGERAIITGALRDRPEFAGIMRIYVTRPQLRRP